MNFSNLPGQIIAIIIGWAFTLWLQRKANTRSEAIRKKDKIIDRTDKVVDWAEKNIPFNPENAARVEEIYAAMISQIEIRVQNLYALLGNNENPLEAIAELRAVDILGRNEHNETIKKLRLATIDLIEDLELACDTRYFVTPPLRERMKQYIYEMYGLIVALIALIALLSFLTLVSSFLSP